jgi:hypothetical protein
MTMKTFSTISVSIALLSFAVMAAANVFAQGAGTGVYVVMKLPSGFNASKVHVRALETMTGYLQVGQEEKLRQEATGDLADEISTFGFQGDSIRRMLRGIEKDFVRNFVRRMPNCCCGFASCAQCYAYVPNVDNLLCQAYCSGGACGARRELQTSSNFTSIPVGTTNPMAGKNCLQVSQGVVTADVAASNLTFYPGYNLTQAKPKVFFCAA